jgi:CBS domain-containing protein
MASLERGVWRRYRDRRLERPLEPPAKVPDMRSLRDVLPGRELNRISPTITVLEAAKFLVSHNTGTAAVFDGTKLVGVFSERDLVRRVVAVGNDPARVFVRDVMTPNPLTALVQDTFDACLVRMSAARCRHLPVFDGERYLGMVSMRDLMSARAQDLQGELRELRDYVAGSGGG